MITLTTLTLNAVRELQQAKTAEDPGVMLRPSLQQTFIEHKQQLHPLPNWERAEQLSRFSGLYIGVRVTIETLQELVELKRRV
jgi:hypothetical protein